MHEQLRLQSDRKGSYTHLDNSFHAILRQIGEVDDDLETPGPVDPIEPIRKLPMEIYTPVHMDCMCYVSGCNLHGGYNMMLSMVYLGGTLKLMQNGLRTTGIGYNTVKMRFMCM